jgi:hypothetical protein
VGEQQRAEHRAGQHVDQRPGSRLADHPFQQRQVGRTQQLDSRLQQEGRDRAALVDRVCPERLGEGQQLAATGDLACRPLRLAADLRDADAEVGEVALQIARLVRRPLGRAKRPQARFDRVGLS